MVSKWLLDNRLIVFDLTVRQPEAMQNTCNLRGEIWSLTRRFEEDGADGAGLEEAVAGGGQHAE